MRHPVAVFLGRSVASVFVLVPHVFLGSHTPPPAFSSLTSCPSVRVRVSVPESTSGDRRLFVFASADRGQARWLASLLELKAARRELRSP